MHFFEKTVSNLIESQFPDVYKETGSEFVEFVKAYYAWMEEEGNTLYHARRLLEHRDIDSTIDEFLIHFKNKYLNNIQFETAASAKNMVKHSLDLYRSKGTERAIDLFFRNIFGVPATVYFPERDIFKLSSGKWIVPKYLEIQVADNMKDFIGVEVEGIDSGATAFIESLVKSRSKGNSKYSYLYYISNIVGSFRAGEKIRSTASGSIGPTIVGSLNELEVTEGGIGYDVGEIVNVRSLVSGTGAMARVSEIATVSGKISFTLQKGGWGFNSNSEVLISNNIFTLTNIEATNTSGNGVFWQFETIVQPTMNIHYTALTGDAIAVGDTIYRTDPVANVIFAAATVVDHEIITGTEGLARVSVIDGHFSGEMLATTENSIDLLTEDGFIISFQEQSLDTNFYIYKYANTSDLGTYDTRATIQSYVNESATANVMLLDDQITLSISNSVIQFNAGEFIYQLNGLGQEISNGIINSVSYNGANATILVNDPKGTFLSNTTILTTNSAATGAVHNISTTVGIIDISGNFSVNEYNKVIGLSSDTTAHLSRISTGSGAAFILSPTFLYEENKFINTDYISDYVGTPLNSSDYGFPVLGAEDLNSNIGQSLTYVEKSYGKIYSIIPTNPGINYDAAPFVLVYDKQTASLNKKDFIVTVANTVGAFTAGEVIQQGTNTRGIVKSFDGTTLTLERITLEEISAIIGTETAPELVALTLNGINSGASAIPTLVEIDEDTIPIGINAVIIANSAIANGSVTKLQVIDSGVSYSNGESVQFYSNGAADYGTAVAYVSSHGTARGYHKNNNSVLSGNKYLRDGDYYQNYSYEVKTSITADRYADMLKDIIHIAGTKFFSRYIFETVLEPTNDISSETVDVQ